MAAAATEAQYQVRPSYAEKFRPAVVKALIAEALSDKLGDKTCAPLAAAAPFSLFLFAARATAPRSR